MDWYKQDGVFTTTDQQDKPIKFDSIHIYTESTEDAQTQVRDALENGKGIYHVRCHPDTQRERIYHLIADSVERAEGWAKVLYRLEDQMTFNE